MNNGKSEKFEKIIDNVASKAENALDSLQDVGDELGEKFSSLKRKISEWGLDEVEDEVKTYVKKNPWKSLGIAAGVGLLIGFVLKSRHSCKE